MHFMSSDRFPEASLHPFVGSTQNQDNRREFQMNRLSVPDLLGA